MYNILKYNIHKLSYLFAFAARLDQRDISSKYSVNFPNNHVIFDL